MLDKQVQQPLFRLNSMAGAGCLLSNRFCAGKIK
jgi:hypothetical protein